MFAFTFLFLLPLAAHAQRPDIARLQRILVAEDMRGTGAVGITPLLEGIRSPDSLLRRVAVRGLGRLQRPAIGRQLAFALNDPVAAVRAEAANAISQSVSRVPRRASDSGQVEVRWAAATLAAALDAEHDPIATDAIAEALGRLPFGDSISAGPAESMIVHRAGGRPGFGVVHGLYWLAQNQRTAGAISPASILLLRSALYGNDPATRRVATLALGLVRALDSATTAVAVADRDEQVRRLGLSGVTALSPAYRATVLAAAFADSSPIVRVGAVGAARAGARRPDCTAIIGATDDRNAYVNLTAIDALALPCADSAAAAATLIGIVDGSLNGAFKRNWQEQAHALVALARVDPARARKPLPSFAASPERGRRIYAAQAGGLVGDTSVLMRLAHDADNNVREAAIVGLMRSAKHEADSVYIAALASRGYQVVLAADSALSGSHHPGVLPALLDAFDRLSAERRENAKDPRVAVLKRIGEMGSSSNVTRLQPYLADFDTTIAANVAVMLSKWMGTPVVAQPRRLPIRVEPLAQVMLSKNVQLKVTMAAASGGGTFTVRLFTDEAPATAARILRLARAHFYDSHVFQRVEPNFVVQGGGPDATEYVGDAQFMRDEIAWRSHLRGTLGISSRGRDTGDAQWFFNLTDNTRLDHEYTVFGEVTAGLAVVERILEGDVIAKVEVSGPQ